MDEALWREVIFATEDVDWHEFMLKTGRSSQESLDEANAALTKARNAVLAHAWDEGADAMHATEPGYPAPPNPYQEN